MIEWFVRFREKGPGKKRFSSPSFTWTWAETPGAAVQKIKDVRPGSEVQIIDVMPTESDGR